MERRRLKKRGITNHGTNRKNFQFHCIIWFSKKKKKADNIFRESHSHYTRKKKNWFYTTIHPNICYTKRIFINIARSTYVQRYWKMLPIRTPFFIYSKKTLHRDICNEILLQEPIQELNSNFKFFTCKYHSNNFETKYQFSFKTIINLLYNFHYIFLKIKFLIFWDKNRRNLK